jgi:hypothetical protein
MRATASGTRCAGSRSAAISAAGRPCSAIRANASAVMPYSPAHRVQQRFTDSREKTSVPSLSNSRASACSFMPGSPGFRSFSPCAGAARIAAFGP